MDPTPRLSGCVWYFDRLDAVMISVSTVDLGIQELVLHTLRRIL